MTKEIRQIKKQRTANMWIYLPGLFCEQDFSLPFSTFLMQDNFTVVYSTANPTKGTLAFIAGSNLLTMKSIIDKNRKA
jgi:hypothetical protein